MTNAHATVCITTEDMGTGSRPEAQTTEMTAERVRNEESALTIDRQT